jgi:hypothetical protein
MSIGPGHHLEDGWIKEARARRRLSARVIWGLGEEHNGHGAASHRLKARPHTIEPGDLGDARAEARAGFLKPTRMSITGVEGP